MAIIIFSILVVGGFYWFSKNVMQVRSNILLGREIDRSENASERWKTMLLVAFGQKKMFTRPIPALLHLCLYVAFIITQIELIEILADGFTGSHRLFRSNLGGFYTFMISFIEILSVLAFVATLVFLSRRNLLKLPRFNMKELAGWPTKDANLILIMEIVLVTFIFMMNGADEVMFNRGISHAAHGIKDSFNFSISGCIGPMLFGGVSDGGLEVIERIGWWGHLLIIILAEMDNDLAKYGFLRIRTTHLNLELVH